MTYFETTNWSLHSWPPSVFCASQWPGLNGPGASIHEVAVEDKGRAGWRLPRLGGPRLVSRWHHTIGVFDVEFWVFPKFLKAKNSGTISMTYPKCMNLISRKHPNISCPNVCWGGPTMLRTFMKSQYWPWRSPTWDLMILMGGPPWELPGPYFWGHFGWESIDLWPKLWGPECMAMGQSSTRHVGTRA